MEASGVLCEKRIPNEAAGVLQERGETGDHRVAWFGDENVSTDE